VVVCLQRGADLHIAQLMPLPLTVSCCSKIQIGFTFLVPAHPGSPRKKAIKRVCADHQITIEHRFQSNALFQGKCDFNEVNKILHFTRSALTFLDVADQLVITYVKYFLDSVHQNHYN